MLKLVSDIRLRNRFLLRIFKRGTGRQIRTWNANSRTQIRDAGSVAMYVVWCSVLYLDNATRSGCATFLAKGKTSVKKKKKKKKTCTFSSPVLFSFPCFFTDKSVNINSSRASRFNYLVKSFQLQASINRRMRSLHFLIFQFCSRSFANFEKLEFATNRVLRDSWHSCFDSRAFPNDTNGESK